MQLCFIFSWISSGLHSCPKRVRMTRHLFLNSLNFFSIIRINASPFLSEKVWWDFNSSIRAAPLFFDRLSVQFVARHKGNEWEREKGGKRETLHAYRPTHLENCKLFSSSRVAHCLSVRIVFFNFHYKSIQFQRND